MFLPHPTATDFTYSPFEEMHDYPETFEDYLNAPTLLINLDRSVERGRICTQRIIDAGFTNVERFSAVDARDKEALKKGWQTFNNPNNFTKQCTNHFSTSYNQQGIALSHFYIWKKIVDEKIPYMNVFEDDVLFHSEWKTLAPDFYARTPKNYDILYTGSQIEFKSEKQIDKGRVFCTHSYTIRYNGAKKLLDMFMNLSIGMFVVDCMIIEMMDKMKKSHPFEWVVWNAKAFPSHGDMGSGFNIRNGGLVYQDVHLN
jgi:GR25 family glycosyltransferase involved in LPS biosynthesis